MMIQVPIGALLDSCRTRSMRISTIAIVLTACDRGCVRTAEVEKMQAIPAATRIVEISGSPFLVKIDAERVHAQGRVLDETKPLLEDGYWPLPKLESAARENETLLRRISALSETDRKVVLADRARSPDAMPVSDVPGVAVIQCDPYVPYQVVKKVLFTLNKAGIGQVNFAVEDPASGRRGRLDLSLGRTISGPQVDLRIEIHAAGYAIVDEGRVSQVPCPKPCTDWSGNALRDALAEIRGRRPAQRTVIVVPDDFVPYQEVIEAMDVLLLAGFDVISISGTPL